LEGDCSLLSAIGRVGMRGMVMITETVV